MDVCSLTLKSASKTSEVLQICYASVHTVRNAELEGTSGEHLVQGCQTHPMAWARSRPWLWVAVAGPTAEAGTRGRYGRRSGHRPNSCGASRDWFSTAFPHSLLPPWTMSIGAPEKQIPWQIPFSKSLACQWAGCLTPQPAQYHDRVYLKQFACLHI